MTAQLSFLPIESSDYKSDVNKVLELIQASRLEFEIGLISTTVRGTQKQIFDLMQLIYDRMDAQCRFSFTVTLSNICGCEI